jgi:beta-glucosidase/6-phospho-beta-glucosidase/beta-galactosidase
MSKMLESRMGRVKMRGENKMAEYFIKIYNDRHKFVDITKTHIGLFVKVFGFPYPIQLAFVLDNVESNEVLKNQDKYIEIMLKTIKDNIQKTDFIV